MKIKRFLDRTDMAPKTTKQRFAICVSNEGCDDLEVWKLYRVLPDAKAAKEDFIRVVDESGEDYLYPSGRFVVIGLPKSAVDKLPRVPAAQGAYAADKASSNSK